MNIGSNEAKKLISMRFVIKMSLKKKVLVKFLFFQNSQQKIERRIGHTTMIEAIHFV